MRVEGKRRLDGRDAETALNRLPLAGLNFCFAFSFFLFYFYFSGSYVCNQMKTDVFQTEFCRVHGPERVLFLDFQDLFHSSLTSCYFCEVKTPAFTAFMFSCLPKASEGQICVLKGIVRLRKVEEVWRAC